MLETYLEKFLEYLKNHRRYSQHTTKNYCLDLKNFATFLKDNNKSFDTINHKDISAWLIVNFKQGKKAKTIARKKSSVKSFYTYLTHHHDFKEMSFEQIKTPKGDKKLPSILSVDRLSGILAHDYKDPLTIRDIAMIDITYSCGIRLSELTGIKLNDISLSENNIRIMGKGSKERIVCFGEKTKITLHKWLNIREDFRPNTDVLFISKRGGAITNRAVQKRFETFAQKNGIEHIHPHMLRHSFASHLLDSSKNIRIVQELLGHSDISSTQIYTHLSIQQLAKSFDENHPRARISKDKK